MNLRYTQTQQSNNNMSKSVRSHHSSASRKTKVNKQAQNAQIKQRIKDILYTVKEERQHIENMLHLKDVEIQSLKAEYDVMKYDNDFEHLSEDEEIILNQLAEGMRQLSIDPTQVLANRSSLKQEQQDPSLRSLSKEEVIKVQQLVISRLKSQLLEER